MTDAIETKYAYTNDGTSMRMWHTGFEVQPGEKFYDTQPTPDQLRADFPNYDTATLANTKSLWKFMMMSDLRDWGLTNYKLDSELIPIRQKFMADIDAATTVDAVQAIKLDTYTGIVSTN